MSYEDRKQKRKSRETNGEPEWKTAGMGNWPLLCSALDSYTDSQSSTSTVSVQLYCRRGRLSVRIQDRADREQTFLDIEKIEEIWDRVEAALRNDFTDWVPMRGKFSE